MAQAKKSAEQAPVQPEATPQPTPAPTGGNKNVGMIVGIVLVLVAGVAGYGYWNGSQVKAYAEKAEGYMEDVGTWDSSAFDPDDAEKIKADVEAILAELNAKNAPSKAKDLEADLKEYFGMAKEVIGFYDVFVAYEAAGEVISEASMDLYDVDYNDPSSVADALEDTQELLKEEIEKLEALSVPEDVKEYHDSMVKYFKDIADVFDGLIAASKSGDIDEFLEASADFADVEASMYDIEPPEDTMKKYEDYDEKFDKLEESIEKEASELKGTSFLLF